MSTDATPWWERFFAADNCLRWQELQNPSHPWSAHVLPWIDIAQSSDHDLPVVLPREDADGRISWYGAGRNPRAALRLREALFAFIGPSYSDFTGRPHALDPTDPIEAALAEGTVTPAYRLQPARPSNVTEIQRALGLYRGLIERMPRRLPDLSRPLGTLRAELDRAVAAGDEPQARALLDRIRAIGRLDRENLLYLDIVVRAGLGYWRELAEDAALLNQLTGLRLPARVLGDLHEALYRRYVAPHEDPSEPERALTAFRDAGLTRRVSLFGSRRGLRTPTVLKGFFLYELAREDAGSPIIDDLAEELAGIDDPFAKALAEWQGQRVSPPTPPSQGDLWQEAEEAFDDLETDRALALYLRCPPSPKRLKKLIRCAEAVGTVAAARSVIEAIEPADGVENLSETVRRHLSALEQRCAPDRPKETVAGWLDWARWVESGAVQDEAMDSLRDNIATWDASVLLKNKDQTTELANIIGNASGTADEIFREAVPLLYQYLVPEGEMPRSLKPLLQHLITKVALLSDPSQSELELARDMVSALLIAGLDKTEYASLILDIKDLVGSQMSMYTLSWSLDLTELLATHSCPAPEERLHLVVLLIDKAERLQHRLTTTDSLVIKQLCQDYDINCPVTIFGKDNSDDNESAAHLAGKQIGIYTLTESAGQRAADLLQQMCPTVRVDLNSDHTCTKTLIHLARSADLFVFAWKSSKHQAFYCVKDHRDPEDPIIQAEGKGTSSILRALVENR